jgi:dihydrofolate reductase
MRRIVVTTIMSVDGYVEGPGGDVMAMNMDAAFDGYCLERLREAGTLLYGATTYRGFMGFWPAMADNLGTGPVHREIGRLNRDLPKVVVSDSLATADLGDHAATTTVLGRDGAHRRLRDLKAAGDGEILVFGSRTLWNDLLAAGLVDELHLLVGPAPVGGGTPAFGGARPPLTLAGHRGFEGSSNVLLRYRV